MVSIDDLARKLSEIPEPEFTHERVLECLRTNRVEIATLSPYLYFCREHYTRNLVRKTDLFELIAICWENGQKSPIHNHRNQRCWMAMAYGKLQVHNFRLVRKDPATAFCELASSGQFVLEIASPMEVDPAEPIHQVLNLPTFGSKAVSLHVYSKPFDTCEVYDLKAKHYEDAPLINTSEHGILKSDWKVEKVQLS